MIFAQGHREPDDVEIGVYFPAPEPQVLHTAAQPLDNLQARLSLVVR